MARVKPLAELVESCMSEALARQGFAGADILSAWPEIVGPRLALYSQPVRMDWPKRRRGAPAGEAAEPATLVIRVESAFALEMQHLAPLLAQRVNAHYGWRCVGRIQLLQGPVRRPPAKRAQPAPLAPAQAAKVAGAVGGVEDEPLRDALERFGAAVLAQGPRTKA